MILIKPYFLVLLAIVSLVYIFLKKERDTEFAFHRFFPTRLHYSVSIGAMLLTLILFNLDHQLLCRPVPWVIGVLAFLFGWLPLFPFLPKNAFTRIITFIHAGGLLFLSVYVLIFFEYYYPFWLLFNLLIIVPIGFMVFKLNQNKEKPIWGFLNFYGLCLFGPLLFIGLMGYYLFKEKGGWSKISVALLPFLFLIVCTYSINRFHKLEDKVNSNSLKKEALAQAPFDKYLLELELGAHWKYHTRFCEYDGWRPPFHDPVLVVSKAIGNVEFNYDLRTRKTEYSWYFPDQPLEFTCKCARHDRLTFNSLQTN